MKNRIWIIIFSAVLIVCAAVWFLVSGFSGGAKIVGIYQNGSLVEKIDLNCVTAEREITLTGDSGKNVILLSHGSVRMKSADCPDQICVNHGELVSAASPIVCLPNKIVIKLENSHDNTDAKSGAIG